MGDTVLGRDGKVDRMRPLKKGEYVENEDGSRSTERTGSFEVDGQHILAPTLWMSDKGPVDMRDDFRGWTDQVLRYEERTGKRFPRFKSEAEARAASKRRSARGGASVGPLEE